MSTNLENKYTGSYLSFSSILNDRENFRKSGGKFSPTFNNFDTPGNKYFKIFFHFANGTDNINNKETEMTGLLAPVWHLNIPEEQWHLYENAWTYLKMNCEDERADLLENFITLLSNISSESPWYFNELGGLDTAITRKVMEDKLTIESTRQKITIKCLPDAFDDRIGTLLDLYRSIVWSWVQKKEILPANLRKFDMSIMVFETPTTPFHQQVDTSWEHLKNKYLKTNAHRSDLENFIKDKYAVIGDDVNNRYKTSFKYYEFHNCEIDYNSTIGNFNQFSNSEGLQPQYNIDIYFDDCYEKRYNEFLLKDIGDFIEWDLYINTTYPKTDISNDKELNNRIDFYKQTDFKENLKSQLEGVGKGIVSSIGNRFLLGNLYTFSLSKLQDQYNSAREGNVFNTARNVNEYYTDYKQRKQNNITTNLFGTPKKRILPTVKKIGNIAQANTIANNV